MALAAPTLALIPAFVENNNSNNNSSSNLSSSLTSSSYKKVSPNIAALDLHSPLLAIRSSASATESGSVCSKSIRRRDVIRPVVSGAVMIIKPNGSPASVMHNQPPPPPEAPFTNNSITPPTTNKHSKALVLHASEETQLTTQTQPHPLSEERRSLRTRRGMDPDEVICKGADRDFIHGSDRPSDPPGECPEDRPVMCLDIVPVGGSNNSNNSSESSTMISGKGSVSRYSGGGNGGDGRRPLYRNNIKWVDPKTVTDASEIDYGILKDYEDFVEARVVAAGTLTVASDAVVPYTGPPSSNISPSPPISKSTLLLTNPRMRIATISSGYKIANYFVREDLDTRIYFHQIEDAIGYMAKRGYVKMPKKEEKEWKALLGRAHGVVKRGPKKEKQRYRKGKLVMILKKTVQEPTKTINNTTSNNKRSSRRKTRNVPLLENGSSTYSASQTNYTEETNSFADQSSCTSAQTERTSLGKSIRGPYKSYSEKFLAEQEEEKRQCLLAIAEGRPLPDLNSSKSNNNTGKTSSSGRLLLTNSEGTGSSMGTDPDADITEDSTRGSSVGSSNTQGTATSYGSETNRTSVANDLKKSHSTMSNRKGVYGGGVRYFTPDKSYNSRDNSDEEEGTTEDEDFEEEDTYDEEEDGRTYDDEEESDVMDVGENSMGSMFSEEEEESTYDYNQNHGVESVTTIGSSEQNEVLKYKPPPQSSTKKKSSGRERRGRSPPDMAPISDESASSCSR